METWIDQNCVLQTVILGTSAFPGSLHEGILNSKDQEQQASIPENQLSDFPLI